MKKAIVQFLGMVALCAALLVGILLLPRDGGDTLPPGNSTPERIGSGRLDVTYDFSGLYFSELCRNVELIADVTITSWLGDMPDFRHRTLFEAKVNYLIKGDAPVCIKIMQTGSSMGTATAYPLFQRGNRMLLFMSDYNGDVPPEIEKHEPWYMVHFSEYAVMDIQSYGNTEYVLDRKGWLTGERFDGNSSAFERIAHDDQEVLREQMRASDPILYQSAGRDTPKYTMDSMTADADSAVLQTEYFAIHTNILRHEDFVAAIQNEFREEFEHNEES